MERRGREGSTEGPRGSVMGRGALRYNRCKKRQDLETGTLKESRGDASTPRHGKWGWASDDGLRLRWRWLCGIGSYATNHPARGGEEAEMDQEGVSRRVVCGPVADIDRP